jgi:transposase
VSRRFANDKSGHWRFVKWLAHGSVQRVVSNQPVPITAPSNAPWAWRAFLTPRSILEARRFAEAIGSLAKTDRLDAAMLARMGAMLDAAAPQRRLARAQGASPCR